MSKSRISIHEIIYKYLSVNILFVLILSERTQNFPSELKFKLILNYKNITKEQELDLLHAKENS